MLPILEKYCDMVISEQLAGRSIVSLLVDIILKHGDTALHDAQSLPIEVKNLIAESLQLLPKTDLEWENYSPFTTGVDEQSESAVTYKKDFRKTIEIIKDQI